MILSVLGTWFGKTTRGRLGYLCIPGLRDVVSIFCWFCKAVEPAMQDIRWGWNILKDWKLERGNSHLCFLWQEQVL